MNYTNRSNTRKIRLNSCENYQQKNDIDKYNSNIGDNKAFLTEIYDNQIINNINNNINYNISKIKSKTKVKK